MPARGRTSKDNEIYYIRCMIAVNELMIGNKVLYRDEVTNVDSISDKGINLYVYYAGNDLVFSVYEFDQLSPIHLTSEILEQAGFQREDNRGYFFEIDHDQWDGDNDFIPHLPVTIHYNNDGNWFFMNGCGGTEYIVGQPFKYLHTLQNAWPVLTGKDISFIFPITPSLATN